MKRTHISSFQRVSKPRSSDPSAMLKAGMIFIFSGFTIHILFIELIIIILRLEPVYVETLILTLTGLPEIDILTPLLHIAISPLTLFAINPSLFFLSLTPWFAAGLFTGLILGPAYDRAILFAPSVFISLIIFLFIFLLLSIMGLGTGPPSVGILTIVLVFMTLALILGMSIAFLSIPLAVPAIIGYSIGKRYSPRSIPQIVFAQPNRQDPDHTRCQFLTQTDKCSYSNNKLIPGTCDNRFNQITCIFYTRAMKKERKLKELNWFLKNEI